MINLPGSPGPFQLPAKGGNNSTLTVWGTPAPGSAERNPTPQLAGRNPREIGVARGCSLITAVQLTAVQGEENSFYLFLGAPDTSAGLGCLPTRRGGNWIFCFCLLTK